MDTRTASKQSGILQFNRENLSLCISLASKSHMSFSFIGGDESLLKKIVRELLCGGILSKNSTYIKIHLYDSEFQYDVHIKNDNFNDLVRMFEYRHKRLGYNHYNTNGLKIFQKNQTVVTYKNENKAITASLYNVLVDAALTANTNKDDLIIKEYHKPNDLNLWTDIELKDENAIAELKKQLWLNEKAKYTKILCNIGIFTTVAVGCLAVGNELYKRWTP